MDLKKLLEPFDPADIEFRAGATNQDKTKALALAYITSRAVMDRLDNVVGPENWQDTYQAGPDGGVLCGISIRINDQWITKFDGASNTNFEAVKGGLSDAFKRAAVKWGCGRYLYSLPAVWVKAEQRGNSVVLDENEARARLFGGQGPAAAAKPAAPAPAPAAPGKKNDGKIANPQALYETVRARTGNHYGSLSDLFYALGTWPDFHDQADIDAAIQKAIQAAGAQASPGTGK